VASINSFLTSHVATSHPAVGMWDETDTGFSGDPAGDEGLNSEEGKSCSLARHMQSTYLRIPLDGDSPPKSRKFIGADLRFFTGSGFTLTKKEVSELSTPDFVTQGTKVCQNAG
jgi:hypothetical protein